jgi:hypothetical protein
MSKHPYEELPGLLFGELNRAEVMVVSDHLAGCDECRRQLAVLAATSASLRATARQAQPAPAPAVDSLERAPSGSATLPHRGTAPGAGSLPAAPGAAAGRPRRRRRPLIGLAAALAVAVAVGLWAGGWAAPAGPTAPSPWPGWGRWPPAAGPAWLVTAATSRWPCAPTTCQPSAPASTTRYGCSTPTPARSFPVGVLPPDGEGRFTLPASMVGRYQVIDVSLEADDGDPTHSRRSLLRGRYA